MVDKWSIPPDGGHMDRATGIYLQTMTGKQVQERLKKNDLIIIPVGSTEAHGLAQPYGEDTFLVSRIAEVVARETGCTVAQQAGFQRSAKGQFGQRASVIISPSTKSWLK